MSRNKPIRADIVDNARNGITMEKVLNSEIPGIGQLDISTGYFNVEGYGMLRKSLEATVNDDSFAMRLLLGKEAIMPTEGSFEKYAERYRDDGGEALSIKTGLDDTDLTEDSRTDTASLVALLERQKVEVRIGTSRFNHSKCYILGDNAVFIGSSNLTRGGLVGNYELNAGLYQPFQVEHAREWFDGMWKRGKDAKKDLVAILNQSKFGAPPEPFEVYMKMLFERFRPLLGKSDLDTRAALPLAKFQQDAVRTGLLIMSDFGGTIIADATGLGKTNMGMEIMRQKILREGKKALLIAPAQVLRSMWEEKLKDVDFRVRETLTTESISRDTILDNLAKYRNVDLVVIDESQNFRSKSAGRRKNLMKLMSIGKRKQVVMLSATPINNSLMDLYYQLSIITGADDSYFYRTVGIPNLYRHMRDAANKEGMQQGLEKVQQLLDSVMVRRTRSYIKSVYKDDRINGAEIKFPRHEYAPIKYSLSELYGNIFGRILADIGSLTMAPYGIGQYDKDIPEEERKQHRVRAHFQTILLLKRFESSVEAVRISLNNKTNLYRHVRGVLNRGKILRIRDFNRIMVKWNSIEGDVDPNMDMDEDDKAEFFMNEIKKIESEKIGRRYDLGRLKSDMDHDLKVLGRLLEAVDEITLDTKLVAVESVIRREQALKKEGRKVLIFTEYTATARYITKHLHKNFKKMTVECLTGRTGQDDRRKYIRRFAPDANLLEDEKLNEKEIDILVSTEVLAEGQNLQDCNYVINYDLPWNPMRIVQRIGRVDRLTSRHRVIHSRACYPDMELDKILNLFAKLIDKISTVNTFIGLESELLGEVPTRRQFGGTTAPRIRALAGVGGESEKVMGDLEQESDVMPKTTPMNELVKYVKERGIDAMKEIPMGRRSGKRGDGQKAIIAYLQTKPERRVYFVVYDYKNDRAHVPDDDFDAIQAAACGADEPKYLPMDGADNRESFEHLLKIDGKARGAIREKNDKVLEYVKAIRSDKKKLYEKNVTAINQVVTEGVIHGGISREDGKSVMKIIKSANLKPWEDEIKDMLAEYRRSKDTGALVAGIKRKGEQIGFDETPKPTSPVEENQELDLRLVGAMFITGERFDLNLGKKGLERY